MKVRSRVCFIGALTNYCLYLLLWLFLYLFFLLSVDWIYNILKRSAMCFKFKYCLFFERKHLQNLLTMFSLNCFVFQLERHFFYWKDCNFNYLHSLSIRPFSCYDFLLPVKHFWLCFWIWFLLFFCFFFRILFIHSIFLILQVHFLKFGYSSELEKKKNSRRMLEFN